MPRGTVGFGEEKCGLEFLGRNFRKLHGTGPSKVRRGLEEGPGEVLSEERWGAETGRGREDPRSTQRVPRKGHEPHTLSDMRTCFVEEENRAWAWGAQVQPRSSPNCSDSEHFSAPSLRTWRTFPDPTCQSPLRSCPASQGLCQLSQALCPLRLGA